jgi:hypothetical protein
VVLTLCVQILLLTPPMTQLNTPYPATAYLTGFLRMKGYNCAQSDPAIELVLRLFSRSGLKRILAEITSRKKSKLLIHSLNSLSMILNSTHRRLTLRSVFFKEEIPHWLFELFRVIFCPKDRGSMQSIKWASLRVVGI